MAEGRDIQDARAENRLRFLAEIGTKLASQLDWHLMMRALADATVPLLADWCVVDILESDVLRRSAVAATPEKRRLAEELEATAVSAASALGDVLRTHRSVVFREVTEAVLARSSSDRSGRLARELGIVSAASVPMSTRGRLIGVMTFAYGASGRHYDEGDVAFLEIVANRAALALDNARLLADERRSRRGAEDARRELEALFELTERANRTTRGEDVYEPALAAIAKLCRVDRASILLFEADGVMRFKAWRGLSDDYRAAVAGHSPWARETREARPIVVEDWRNDPGLSRYASIFDAERIRALAFVPIVHGDELLGKFMLYDDAPRVFTDHDIHLAGLVAAQVAQAVARSRLIDRERAARSAAERQAERTRRLQRVTAQLSRALDESEIADVVLEEGVAALDAYTAGLWRVSGDGDGLEALGTRGYSPAIQAQVRELPLDPAIPLGDAVIRGEAVWLDSAAAYRARYPTAAERIRGELPAGDIAIACLPLRLDGRVLGALAFSVTDPQRVDPEERTFIELLAQNCAQALDRARLYQAELAARVRAAFLAEASALLAASLDVAKTLQNVADLAVPRIADWCVVDLDVPDAQSMMVAVAHVDPEKRALAREWRDRWPPQRDAPSGVFQVMRTGRAELYVDIPDALIDAIADPEQREVMRGLALRSAIVAPIRAHGRSLGAITLIYSESGRRYGPDDLAVIEQLGERAAIAITNAQLFEGERSARKQATKLQRVTAAFGAGTTVAEVARVAVELARDLMAADTGTVALTDEEHHTVDLVAQVGLPPDLVEQVRHLDLSIPSLARQAIETASAQFVEDATGSTGPVSSRYGAGVAVPLRLRGRVLGIIGLAFQAPRTFADDDRVFVQAIADQCAQAIDRARSYDQAVRAISVRDDFLSVAGHELKTPLTALMLQGQSLGRMSSDARIVERAEKLVRQASRLGKLVDELLDVSRITAGRLRLELEDVDLTTVVVENVGRLTEELARAGSQVRLAVEGELHGHWDRSRIEQVVSNLLSNAIKYGAGKPIDVAASRAEDRAIVVVRDRGIGIAAEDQARIFGRFERAVSSRHFGGLGLGLWIVRQIVEAHGGTIAVDSAPGEGAEFRVELPLSP